MLQVEEKLQVYDAVTNCIIDLLKRGIIPWHTSWADSGIPSNLLTNRPYRAINILMLAAHGYEQNYFLTERQVEKIGGYIYKGENPHLVIDGIGFRSLRPYEVYNLSQVGNVSGRIIPKQCQREPSVNICKEVIERMDHCPKLVHGDITPAYDPEEDIIHMPSTRYFANHDEYFNEFFKQMITATKHPLRLDSTDSLTGGLLHEMDQLVKEIGAWYLRSYTGIEIKHSCNENCIRHWINAFESNPCLAFEAAELAQEAVEFILGKPFDKDEAIDYVEDEMLPF